MEDIPPVEFSQESGLHIIENGPPDAAVDIIAVHGLAANPAYTWVKRVPTDIERAPDTDSNKRRRIDKGYTSVMWLKHLLPTKVSKARILKYNYDSNYLVDAPQESLRSIASRLVYLIYNLRKNDRNAAERPIIFIGHSFGGIVIADALVYAYQHDDQAYKQITLSTCGAIFLGTPFRGSKASSWGVMLANCAAALGLQSNNRLLKTLSENSEVMERLMDDFTPITRKLSMRLICFYETKPTKLGKYRLGLTTFLVDKTSATIDSHRPRSLTSDHSDMNKFGSLKDENFILVSGAVEELVEWSSGFLLCQPVEGTLRLFMSGFEIAGIVLGAFPLLIEGLKYYSSTAEAIRALWRPRIHLERIATKVQMEVNMLRDTIMTLLDGVVDEGQILNLVDRGDGWSDKALHRKLNQKMKHSTGSFVEGVRQINKALEVVKAKLQLPDNHDPVSGGRWREIIAIINKKELEALIDSISKMNKNLDHIVKSIRPSEEAKSSCQLPPYVAQRYQHLREHAVNLYTFLRQKLSIECTCHLNHFASLQLDTTCFDCDSKIPNSTATDSSKINLKMMISYDPKAAEAAGAAGAGPAAYDWLEFDLQSQQTIIKVCQEYPETQEPKAQELPATGQSEDDQPKHYESESQEPRCIETHTLNNPQNSKAIKRKVAFAESPVSSDSEISPPTMINEATSPTETADITFCTLGEAISIHETVLPKDIEMFDKLAGFSYFIMPLKVTRRSEAIGLEKLLVPEIIKPTHRARIALQLGFLVLELYDTKWLPETWGARNILFVCERKKRLMADCRQYQDSLEPVLRKPLLQQLPEKKLIQGANRPLFANYNQTIYSLGIVLTELALENPLEELSGVGKCLREKNLAMISQCVGPNYAKAVENCIQEFYCTALNKKNFHDKFYEKVLVPLRKHWQWSMQISPQDFS